MLTFILTCYNRPEELAALFKSLDAQTAQDFETIIVDDNSSDPTIEQLANDFLKRHGGTFVTSDIQDAQRKDRVRYAENINYILSVLGRVAKGDLLAYLCDDVELAPTYVETVLAHFDQHPDHLAGYVSEEWVQDGTRINLLWYEGAMTSAFCALDHSQVIHRREYAVPWAVHPLAWAFADGIAFERLLGRVGAIYPIGDATPLVTNKILASSVCRQPIEEALEKLSANSR